ncbi:hypothetical protein BpHYR1_053884 [Brachionus plicatilis]|uniref:Uncharacterized protein n=1 Tax=Brachionus plicatilis TaxID=10195 RepID=A0A3M7T1Y2_BRAPC|nr:hypothetical protein BpHYR1_053884 [Brachionus plicatilis]
MKKDIKEITEFNYLNKRLEAEREKAVRGYYNNIILKAIESNYKVVSKSKLIEPSNGENNYEINSIIKFKSLDDAISWSPEFCWLSQLDCSNYADSFFFSKNADHSDFYYYDEFDSPWKMEQEFDFGSNMVRHRRSSDYGFETQTKLVNHILLNYSTKIQKVQSKKKYFLHEIQLKLRLDKTPKHFKIVLCNLKPFADCNDSFKSNENYSKEKRHHNEACEETKLKQFFEQNSVDRKMKTVFLTNFDRNGNLVEFVDYDSNKRSTRRIQCSKLIPKNALNDAHLTSPSLSQKSTSSLPQTQNFYQSVLLFLNLNKVTVILIFVSSIVSLFLIILVILICKKSNRDNNSELNSHLSKGSTELKPLNSVKGEYENRENIELKFKLLSAEKNGNLFNKKKRIKKKKKFDLKKTICEV